MKYILKYLQNRLCLYSFWWLWFVFLCIYFTKQLLESNFWITKAVQKTNSQQSTKSESKLNNIVKYNVNLIISNTALLNKAERRELTSVSGRVLNNPLNRWSGSTELPLWIPLINQNMTTHTNYKSQTWSTISIFVDKFDYSSFV